ncbi:MAG: alpha/beta fold hydrolase, partial [Anaerolineales bacterium]
MNIQGYDFAVEKAGSGEPLIFVHGSAADYEIWQEQQSHFADHFRAIRYSRRYHWPNKPIPEGADYAMADHVADLKAIIQEAAEPPVHLVGHSYGAIVCLLLAMDTPQLIRRMVLAEPPAITLFVSNDPKPGELLRLLLRRPRTALSIIQLGVQGFEPAKKAAREGDLDQALDVFGRFTLGDEYYENMSDEDWQKARRNMIKAEFLGSGFPKIDPAEVKQVDVPTLLIQGEDSPSVFHRVLDYLEELVPKINRVEIPDASHVSQLNNPEAYRSAVMEFL